MGDTYPTERELSGIFAFALRDGKRKTVDISDMTEDELDALFESKGDPDTALLWWFGACKHLCRCLHEIGDEFDILCERG